MCFAGTDACCCTGICFATALTMMCLNMYAKSAKYAFHMLKRSPTKRVTRFQMQFTLREITWVKPPKHLASAAVTSPVAIGRTYNLLQVLSRDHFKLCGQAAIQLIKHSSLARLPSLSSLQGWDADIPNSERDIQCSRVDPSDMEP